MILEVLRQDEDVEVLTECGDVEMVASAKCPLMIGAVSQRSRGLKWTPVGSPPSLKMMKIWPEAPQRKPEELDQQRKTSQWGD